MGRVILRQEDFTAEAIEMGLWTALCKLANIETDPSEIEEIRVTSALKF